MRATTAEPLSAFYWRRQLSTFAPIAAPDGSNRRVPKRPAATIVVLRKRCGQLRRRGWSDARIAKYLNVSKSYVRDLAGNRGAA